LKELKSIRELIAELREILASDKETQAGHHWRAARSSQAYGETGARQIVDKSTKSSWKT